LIFLPFNVVFTPRESHRFGPSTGQKSNTTFTLAVCGSPKTFGLRNLCEHARIFHRLKRSNVYEVTFADR
jgi:hypothetical protein